MDFSNLLGRDITVYTDARKHRGILVDILVANNGFTVLAFKVGVDEFYIEANKVHAVTVHGREFVNEVAVATGPEENEE